MLKDCQKQKQRRLTLAIHLSVSDGMANWVRSQSVSQVSNPQNEDSAGSRHDHEENLNILTYLSGEMTEERAGNGDKKHKEAEEREFQRIFGPRRRNHGKRQSYDGKTQSIYSLLQIRKFVKLVKLLTFTPYELEVIGSSSQLWSFQSTALCHQTRLPPHRKTSRFTINTSSFLATSFITLKFYTHWTWRDFCHLREGQESTIQSQTHHTRSRANCSALFCKSCAITPLPCCWPYPSTSYMTYPIQPMCLHPAEDFVPGRPYSEIDLSALPGGLSRNETWTKNSSSAAGDWDMVICGEGLQGLGIWTML